MADNYNYTSSGSRVGASDDVGPGVDYPRVKIVPGVDGAAEPDVSSTNALPVRGHSPLKNIIMTPDTAALANGEVFADTQVLSNCFRRTDGNGIWNSLTFICQADQKAACTVVLLDANVSMGTENAAPSVTDANAVNIIGHVDILTSDYKDWGGVSTANIRGIAQNIQAIAGTKDIAVAIVGGASAPIYTASSIVLRLGIDDN